ncbi:hypothetical protein [Kytococcus sedentarius]|uniref:hypothetical protein n=1 Tax=Kytococcus sedentarius TaxID=1276 RepID=UPI0035BC4246
MADGSGAGAPGDVSDCVSEFSGGLSEVLVGELLGVSSEVLVGELLGASLCGSVQLPQVDMCGVGSEDDSAGGVEPPSPGPSCDESHPTSANDAAASTTIDRIVTRRPPVDLRMTCSSHDVICFTACHGGDGARVRPEPEAAALVTGQSLALSPVAEARWRLPSSPRRTT